jgi:hypothetical protein
MRGIGEPQTRQKTWVKKRASGSLNDASASSPRVKRTLSAVPKRFEAWAAARAFRQR